MDVQIENLDLKQDSSKLAIPAYFVRSTAQSNVEDSPPITTDTEQPTLQDVVEVLYRNSQNCTGNVGLVIAIHGYNTGADEATDGVREHWYKPLCQYINQDPFIRSRENGLVFLGYRWPSESMKKKTIRPEAFKALPLLMGGLFYGGIAICLLGLIGLLFYDQMIAPAVIKTVAMALLVLGVLAFAIVLSLYLLRISVYFRDSYRATYYGVPDLVDLIRNLDQSLVDHVIQNQLTDDYLYQETSLLLPASISLSKSDLLQIIHYIRQEIAAQVGTQADLNFIRVDCCVTNLKPTLPGELQSDEVLTAIIQRLIQIEQQANQEAQAYWRQRPIKLSFIGHSMGGHVTTQVIRILNDVFDPRAIFTPDKSSTPQKPPSRIGRAFKLGRLVLVAPDIPLLTITSGRGNFLRSALRRFEEAYLFSNEGDLALRIASTAANYFSFPARTRTQGYRLGNLSVSPKNQTTSKSKTTVSEYGVLNWLELANPNSHLLPYLEINVLSEDRNQRLDPASQQQERRLGTRELVASQLEDQEAIADLFTYFDCTEYCDRQIDLGSGKFRDGYVLILNNQRSPLKLPAYFRLFTAYAQGKRDVHGGYFQGPYTQLLMYRLAFIGMQGLLDSLVATPLPQLCTQLNLEETCLPEDLRLALNQLERPEFVGHGDSRTALVICRPPYPEWLRKQRQLGLQIFSWISQQKQIQVAVSPERYQVDIEGRDRSDMRRTMLFKSAKLDINSKSD